MTFVYGIFGFTFELKLSTRPEKFLGDVETWNNAEKQVRVCACARVGGMDRGCANGCVCARQKGKGWKGASL